MALARIEVLEGLGQEEKRSTVYAVRSALSDALRAPAEDAAVRLVEYPAEQFAIS